MGALPFPPLLERLGLTLLHAVWLLTALAFVAWLGLALLRRVSAQARYVWACICLVAMPTACAVTYALLGPLDPGPPLEVLQAVPVTATLTSPAPSVWEGVQGPVAPWLALVWVVGALIQVLRLGGAVWRVHRIFLREAEPAPPAWEQACRQLARYLGIPSPVRLLVSARVSTPLTLGWLRPVVLLPVSSLLHLTPEALEAVLAHELAHVRRLDYLANLVQTLIDALLFFHPAARWLSGQIRELREHCCDDEAAALCGDPVALAQGLTTLERLRRAPEPTPEPALAAAKGSLMSRITRMLVPQPAPLPVWRGLALVLAGASLVGAATLALPPTTGATEAGPSVHVMTLTMPLEPSFYPTEARKARIQGTVKLLARHRVQGGFTVQAMEGPQVLRAAAEACVRASFQILADLRKDIDWHITMDCRIPGEGPFQEKMLSRRDYEDAKAAFEKQKSPARSEDVRREIARLEAEAKAAREAREQALNARHGITNASGLKLVSRGPLPPYPPTAVMARESGVVECRLQVDPEGVVKHVEVLSGPEEWRGRIRKWALTWVYEKSPQGGEVIIRQTYHVSGPRERDASMVTAREAMTRARGHMGVISVSDPALKVVSMGSVPEYPPIARMARIQGDVLVELTVVPEGTVRDTKAIYGPVHLRRAAEQAALGWTFESTPKGGTATVRIPFRLE